MKFFALTLAFVLSFTCCLHAQYTCTTALPICDSFITVVGNFYTPDTNINELPPGTCLTNGLNATCWYTFTCVTPGSLQFKIAPLETNQDYDFALFNITGYSCADIATDTSLLIRCNDALNDIDSDSTGIGYGGYGTSSGGAGPTFNAAVTIGDTPQTFILVVNDFTGSGTGFTIDFTQSAAKFGTTIATPFSLYRHFDTICSGNQWVILSTSSLISCPSITPANCTLIGPPGLTINGIMPLSCQLGITDSFIVELNDTIPADSDLQIVVSDTLSVPFGCSWVLPGTDTLHVHVLPHQQLGFLATLRNDTAFISNSAVGVDSVYYVLTVYNEISGDTTSDTFPGNTGYMVLPNGVDVITQYGAAPGVCSTLTPPSSTFYLLVINNLTLSNPITVSPNPSAGQFYFKGIPAGSTLEVYDVLGQNVFSTEVNSNNYILILAGNARTIYFYRVTQSSNTIQQGKIFLE